MADRVSQSEEPRDLPLRVDEAQMALDVLTRFAAEPQALERASCLVTLGVAIREVAGEGGYLGGEVAFALHRAIEAYRVGGHVPPLGAVVHEDPNA